MSPRLALPPALVVVEVSEFDFAGPHAESVGLRGRNHISGQHYNSSKYYAGPFSTVVVAMRPPRST